MQSQAIRYDLLVQDALRGMVRDLLAKVARDGLPGDHHFFITFKTHAPGVQLSARMKARYPDEITIVLQHQFWDLSVNDRQFEVGLSFSNIPERLVVPFSALTGFHDPSVPFMLKFEPKDAIAAEEQSTEPTSLPRPAAKTETLKPAKRTAPEPAAPPAEASAADAKGEAAEAPAASEPAKVVSIDAFRKKT
ncbi:MAG: SspB family protein [Beijerinckiaceae bacterium]